MTDQWACSTCGEVLDSERDAMAHECGVPRPVPTLADTPMLTREAVTILANQLAGMTEVLGVLTATVQQVVEKMDKFGEVWEKATTPMILTGPIEPPDSSWVTTERLDKQQ